MLSELAGASSTQPRLQLGNEPQLSCRGCRSCRLPVTRGALPRAGAELLAGEGRTPGRPWQDSTAVQGTAATPHPSPLPAHRAARNSPADTKKGEASQTLSQKDDPRLSNNHSSYVYSACAYGSGPCDISAHAGRKNVPRLLASCFCVVACARGYMDTRKEEMDLDPKVHKSVIQRADTGKATGNCLDSCCKTVV